MCIIFSHLIFPFSLSSYHTAFVLILEHSVLSELRGHARAGSSAWMALTRASTWRVAWPRSSPAHCHLLKRLSHHMLHDICLPCPLPPTLYSHHHTACSFIRGCHLSVSFATMEAPQISDFCLFQFYVFPPRAMPGTWQVPNKYLLSELMRPLITTPLPLPALLFYGLCFAS